MPAATMPESAHMVVGDDFPTNHKDLVHHVAYDFYGQRMATCSSDHSVKVWDLQDGAWVLSAELKVCRVHDLRNQLPFKLGACAGEHA
jgi:WD40 repeat protein